MNKETIKVFEGFAGYGGASFGLKRSGLKYKVVGMSEFDKFASDLLAQNFPGIKNWGDITKTRVRSFLISTCSQVDSLVSHSPQQVYNQPKPNKHFEDRLFDRDTLLLREYEINLIFLIAAYGSYEDHWATSIRATIREDMLQFLTDTYAFFKIQPNDIPMYSQNGPVGTIPFLNYFHNLLAGKVYKECDDACELILAFEKTTELGIKDLKEVQEDLQHAITGGSITDPIELKP